MRLRANLLNAMAALAVALPIVLSGAPASAQIFQDQSILFGRWRTYEGRWCAHLNTGVDRVEEDCSFDSFEACRFALGNVNFGFCTQNPAYAGPTAGSVRRKSKKRVR